MHVIMWFFKFVKQIWQKMTCWVVFCRCHIKQTIMKHTSSKKHALKEVEKTFLQLEGCKWAKSPGEAKFLGMEEAPKAAEPCVLTNPMSRTQSREQDPDEGHSLLQVPWTAVWSASMIMFSALQSSWQMCRWKSSVSSASISPQVRTSSPLDTPEAELLREVYLVLWAIRKQLRHLAHRQERRRRHHHIRANSSALAEPVLELKQDARSPL
ncbi:uncharacterized protein C7orf61 homolog isoform X2 [Heterocephalus glaber]|uniref:Uncharacterized protein C7orf61 n=1 Tax=Heterocephalus glaber TaxID=10181 RepID=A0A0P6J1V5_HETGA|nr:uncharacterized protein C7orf61 homolog isoform X2 [Heterocephalus glaber]